MCLDTNDCFELRLFFTEVQAGAFCGGHLWAILELFCNWTRPKSGKWGGMREDPFAGEGGQRQGSHGGSMEVRRGIEEGAERQAGKHVAQGSLARGGYHHAADQGEGRHLHTLFNPSI